MRMFLILLILVLIPPISIAQVEYTSPLLQNTVYNNAPDDIKKSKAFIREWTFFEERAFPENYIPEGVYQKSINERNALRVLNKSSLDNIQWENIGPTPGYYFSYGNISSRIVTGAYHPENPEIIFIGPANGGVWKTYDSGQTWIPLTDDKPSLSMGAIAIDHTNPDIIYAGTGEATYSGVSYYGAGLLKSIDGGNQWQHITNGLPLQTYFSRLVIRPGKNSELLAALGNSGLYRSSNSGASWYQLLSGRCDDVLFDPTGDTAFAVGSGVGFRRSTNGGLNFSTFGSNLPGGTRTHIDISPNFPNIIYSVIYTSSTPNVRTYKSTNTGLTWNQVAVSHDFNGSQAWYDLFIRIHPKNPDIVFVGTIDIYRSTNGGNNFTNITYGYSGGNVHVDQHYLFFHPTDSTTIISCNDGGINRSTNLGNSFSNLNQNLTLTQFYRITVSPFDSRRLLGGTQDNGTQETRGTLNWNAPFGGDGGEVCFNPFDPNFIIGETQNGGLRRTTNGGLTWVNAMTGINTSEAVAWIAPIIAHPKTNGTFYVARQKVYRSTDNGGNWTAISENVNSTSAVRELAISQSNPEVMFATSSSRVFRSIDGGATWTNVTVGLPNKTLSSVYIHPDSSNIAFITFLGFGGSKVYKTTNNGANWFSISGNLPDSPVTDFLIYPDNPGRIYFTSTDIGVFVTTNGGGSWEELYNGLPNTVIRHLDYSKISKKLIAGTHGRGVYAAAIDFMSATVNFSTPKGWSLISLPVAATEMAKDSLFPNSESAAFNFSDGYEVSNILNVGTGYWLKFPALQSHSIKGRIFDNFSIPVRSGWNLIGGLHSPINTASISSIPPNILSTEFFGYNGQYVISNVLNPGSGYWVKTNSAGTLIINSSYKVQNFFDRANFERYDIITITDAQAKELFLYLNDGDENLDRYELPPFSPDIFSDVRFSSGKLIENSANDLDVQITNLNFPIKISFNSLSKDKIIIEHKTETGQKTFILSKNDEYLIHNLNDGKLKLKIAE